MSTASPRRTTEQRAAERRATWTATWTATVVELGGHAAPLYAELDIAARLQAFVALNRRVWQWTPGVEAGPSDRSQWPGEVIDLGVGRP